MESFDPRDGAATLPTISRRVGWFHLVAGRPLVGWHESLLANVGRVLVMAYVLFSFIGIRARTRRPGY